MQAEEKGPATRGPVLHHIANLWTLQQHPSRDHEWSLRDKLNTIRDAGFDGVCWAPSAELRETAKEMGLLFVGGMASGDRVEFPRLLRELKDGGAVHVNVQLGSHNWEPRKSLDATIALMEEGESLGLLPAIEFHRGTCAETPEKAYALADAYDNATGRMLRVSWDFSHFAVVKHLVPNQFAGELLRRPKLIQYAQQFHFRPFNGHHVQVPITQASGELTREVRDWLPFAADIIRCWLDGHRDDASDIYICPELGPVDGGYALSTFPSSWEDAKVLRTEIDKLWKEITG